MTRRGYVLPMVILLSLVAALFTGVMIERVSAQRGSVRRMLERYQQVHNERGMRELIDRWIETLPSGPTEQFLEENGHALDVELQDGSFLSVYLYDAQGRARRDGSRLKEQEAERADGIAFALRNTGEVPERMWRDVGPAAVDVRRAEERVIEAVVTYVMDGEAPASLVSEIVRKARDERFDNAAIGISAVNAGATSEQRALLIELLTVEPALWRVVVEQRSAPPTSPRSELLARYVGMAVVRTDENTGGQRLSDQTTFLSWEDVGTEDDWDRPDPERRRR